jgi:hypothetical protein
MDTYSKDGKIRDTVLVLPSTFFSDCFLDYGNIFSQTRMRDLAWATVIGEFILVRKAFYPNLTVAVTTKNSYKEFKAKVAGRNIGELSLTSLEDAVLINSDKAVDALSMPEQSLLAVANDIYKENNQIPIIVVRPEASEKWKTGHSDQFYKEHKEARYRVEIYTMRETLIHIKSKYQEEYKRALANLENIDNAELSVQIKLNAV